MALYLSEKPELKHLSFKFSHAEVKFGRWKLDNPCSYWDALRVSHVSPPSSPIKRTFNLKIGSDLYVLDTPKNPRAIDQTEGILSDLSEKLDEEGIEPTDLIKRAWK